MPLLGDSAEVAPARDGADRDVTGLHHPRYQAQIAQAIPADDANLRAAIISAITLGITVSRHLIQSDELASADPAQVISREIQAVAVAVRRPQAR